MLNGKNFRFLENPLQSGFIVQVKRCYNTQNISFSALSVCCLRQSLSLASITLILLYMLRYVATMQYIWCSKLSIYCKDRVSLANILYETDQQFIVGCSTRLGSKRDNLETLFNSAIAIIHMVPMKWIILTISPLCLTHEWADISRPSKYANGLMWKHLTLSW